MSDWVADLSVIYNFCEIAFFLITRNRHKKNNTAIFHVKMLFFDTQFKIHNSFTLGLNGISLEGMFVIS